MKKSPRDTSIGAQMAIASQLMKRKHHQALTQAGYKITVEQLAVLEILHIHGDMNMSTLSKILWKQNANITRIVDKLENRKLVIRKAIKGDRRAYLVALTDDGKVLLEAVTPIVISTYKDMVSPITPEEEEITLRTIKKIIDHLSKK